MLQGNGSDLMALTAFVQSQVDGLAARGEVTNDLGANLFKGYKAFKVVFLNPSSWYVGMH